jgi:hypothetical protein
VADESVAARYLIELVNTDSETLDWYDRWESISFSHKLNDIGRYTITLNESGNLLPDRFNKIVLDSMLVVHREVPGCGLDMYPEFSGLHRKTTKRFADGVKLFISNGFHLNEILSRRVVAANEGTIRADKSGGIEIMGEYVDENLFWGAAGGVRGERYFYPEPGEEPPVEAYGWMPGFSWQIESVHPRAPVWSGSRSFDNLLDVLKDIGLFMSVDFHVFDARYAGATWTPYALKLYGEGIGENHSMTDLDARGMNTFGYRPVVFSPDHENVEVFEWDEDASSEANRIFVLGQGEKSTRAVLPITNDWEAQSSPINLREIAGSASDQEFVFQMQEYGWSQLKEREKISSFTITPRQTPGALYGKHYHFGDTVSVLWEGEYHNRRITELDINIDKDGVEKITNMVLSRLPSLYEPWYYLPLPPPT